MTLARFAAPALALATGSLAAAILIVRLPPDGLVERPTLLTARARAPWLREPAAPAVAPDAATWPATPEGLTAALATADDALDACHAEWTRVQPDAPTRAVATVRLARRPDGTARAVEVTLEGGGAGAQPMEACARSALGGLVFTDPPDSDLIVRFALTLDDSP